MKNTKTLFTIILIGALILELGNCNLKAAALTWDIDWDAQGFTAMKTTAYCMGHHTANGSAVHEGGCAASADHMGDLAVVYTRNGEYVGIYEVNDTGGTDAIREGRVIDVYFPTYELCEEYMKLTEGKCYVKWVKGNG